MPEFLFDLLHEKQNSPVVKFYLLLKELFAVLLSPSIRSVVLDAIEDTMKVMFNLFKSEFIGKIFSLSGKKKKMVVFPKMHHFSAHYILLTKRYGPLIHFSTERFERKNKLAAEYSKITNNFVNLAFSIASHEQEAQACYLNLAPFVTHTREQSNGILLDSLPNGQSMKKSEFLFPTTKQIMRRINSSRMWIKPEDFLLQNGTIYLFGEIYELSSETSFIGMYPLKYLKKQYISLDQVSHLNDFLYKSVSKDYYVNIIFYL